MAEEDNGQEKTLDPSAKKLAKGKADGDVLKSQEMFVFGTTFMGLIVLSFIGMISESALASWASLFRLDHPESLSVERFFSSELALNFILGSVAIFGIPSVVTVLFIQTCVGGSISFSAKAVSFKPDKLDPIKGLKKIISVKGLVELVKGFFKILLLIGISATIVWAALPKILHLSSSSLEDGIAIFYQTLLVLLGSLVVILGIIGAADFLYQREAWLKKMRMSHKDQKDEQKDSDGTPEVKSRIRRLQMEASQKASQRAHAVSEVHEASVIITNPTHFAVALKYAPDSRATPYVIASGKGPMALRIIDEGEKAKITRVQSPVLARALYFTSDIGSDVSEDLFSAVASVLAYVLQLERGADLSFEDPEIPKDLQYDEFGSKL